MNDLGATTGIEHGDHRHARVLRDVRPHGGAGRDGGTCGGIWTVSAAAGLAVTFTMR